MESTCHQTKGKNDQEALAHGYICFKYLNVFILTFSLFYRYIYVVEFFDQKVHVLERKEDNSLANVKVANKTDLPQQCGIAFLTVFKKNLIH